MTASTRPLGDIADFGQLRRLGVGVDHLRINAPEESRTVTRYGVRAGAAQTRPVKIPAPTSRVSRVSRSSRTALSRNSGSTRSSQDRRPDS